MGDGEMVAVITRGMERVFGPEGESQQQHFLIRTPDDDSFWTKEKGYLAVQGKARLEMKRLCQINKEGNGRVLALVASQKFKESWGEEGLENLRQKGIQAAFVPDGEVFKTPFPRLSQEKGSS